MKCTHCGYPESKVVDSRPLDDGASTRRRRECMKCGHRFTTYEKPELSPVFVIKKDNSREPFDIEKIKRGMLKACEKRNVSIDTIDSIALDIERQVQNDVHNEVPTSQIGEMIMTALRDVDQVAYVRFASVYREFQDLDTFMAELKELMARES